MGSIDEQIEGTSDAITPIDFTPNDGKGSGVEFNLKFVHVIVVSIALVFGVAGWFVLTAKSVFVEANPITANIDIKGGFYVRLGQRYLIRSGSYALKLQNVGYHDTSAQLIVSDEQSQLYSFEMQRLPGVVTIETVDLPGARVQIDGIDVGVTPLIDIAIESGQHQMAISLDRYLDYGEVIEIEGREVQQRFQSTLEPAWAVVSLSTAPIGADVLIDGAIVGETPVNVEILQGQHDLTLKLAGYKAWQDDFDVTAGVHFAIPQIELEPADGLVFIRSNPTAASVTIGGEFKGLTPIEVALSPGENHEITFFKSG